MHTSNSIYFIYQTIVPENQPLHLADYSEHFEAFQTINDHQPILEPSYFQDSWPLTISIILY